jgi:hypothetical protein
MTGCVNQTFDLMFDLPELRREGISFYGELPDWMVPEKNHQTSRPASL